MRDRVEALDRRIAALAAQRDALTARERQRARVADLRRKILVGALVLSRWPAGAVPEEWRQALDAYLTRSHDRALFGFEAAGSEKAHERPE
jgi:hypothetical protein